MPSVASQEVVDVIVVGGGNAGFSAAHAAAERGRRVLLLEVAPHSEAGGNSFYTAGATRITHGGLEDIRDLVDEDPRLDRTEVPAYTAEDYASDLAKVTGGQNDPDLTEVLVNESQSTLRWLHGLGLRYRLMYERQSYEREDGVFGFWGGLHIGNTGGGIGLIDDHTRVAGRLGVEVRYGHNVTELMTDADQVVGVRFTREDGTGGEVRADSVVLAAGGFESDPARRAEHLGERWEFAKVRGTPFNTGTMLDAALEIGADRAGDWTSCHSVQWDAFAEDNESNRELTNRLTRSGYPAGIIVNRDGRRFVDEGEDFRNYTYAKFGRSILEQHGSIAYQIYDSTQRPLLRKEEYDMPGISVQIADDIPTLARRLGQDPGVLCATVADFNAAIDDGAALDMTSRDGRASHAEPPKSNWAVAIERPPFYGFAVTCGITFTFGGLRSDTSGRVLRRDGSTIGGLFVCGEMLGGLFSQNYPGGSGLAAGMVFGRRAGLIA